MSIGKSIRINQLKGERDSLIQELEDVKTDIRELLKLLPLSRMPMMNGELAEEVRLVMRLHSKYSGNGEG